MYDSNGGDNLAYQKHLARMNTDTNSSVSSTATAPNLPGAGRTVGLLTDFLGAHVEKFMNVRAGRLGLGPKAIAQEIRRLRRHDETSLVERHAGSVFQLNKRDERIFKKLCKKLLKYARFVSLSYFFHFWLLFPLKAQDPDHTVRGTGRDH